MIGISLVEAATKIGNLVAQCFNQFQRIGATASCRAIHRPMHYFTISISALDRLPYPARWIDPRQLARIDKPSTAGLVTRC